MVHFGTRSCGVMETVGASTRAEAAKAMVEMVTRIAQDGFEDGDVFTVRETD